MTTMAEMTEKHHLLQLEQIVMDMLKGISEYNSHMDASRCDDWITEALLRLESKGRVVRRSVTIHYGYDANGVEATTNYVGFFLK